MASARYFLPDHPSLKEVYTRHELRSMLLAGSLSRSEIVLDDETGLAHLLGDLLAMPYPGVTAMPTRSTSGLQPDLPVPGNHEFRADTPLQQPEPSRSRPPFGRGRENDSRLEEEPFDDAGTTDEYEEEYEDDSSEEEDEWEDEGDVGDDLDSEAGEDEDAGVDEEEDEDGEPSPASMSASPFQAGGRAAGASSSTLRYEPAHAGDDEEDEDKPARDSTGLNAAGSGEPEEMLYVGHPSWFAYPRSMVAVVLALGCAWLAYHYQFGIEWPLLFGCTAGIVLLFVGLDRYTSTYFITTRRVEMEYGIIGRNTKEVRIRDIRAIDVHQAGFPALLGLGTVKFDSSASSGPEVFFKNVRRPHDIKELVRELQG